jgi:hypothetical protein
MKKLIAILATTVVAGGLSAFGQGYVLFSSAGGYVYDEFTTPGSDVKSSGTSEVTFLWNTVGASDPLGPGVPTTGTANSGASGYADIESMLSGGWQVAVNAAGSNEADVVTSTGAIAGGGFNYNTGTAFQLAGTTGGNTYQFVVVAWNAAAGSTLEAAMGDATAFGWSSALDYATGAATTSSTSAFSSSGLSKFGVAPVPEPATLALAGLGGLATLMLRRRKA